MLLPCLLIESIVSLIFTWNFSLTIARQCCEYSEYTQEAEFMCSSGKLKSNVDFSVFDISVFELCCVC